MTTKEQYGTSEMSEHASVEEMVNALSSESFAAEFAEQNAKTQLSQALSAARVASGMTEREIADRLGWTEDDVVRFEYQETDEISLGDLACYLGALGIKVHLSFLPSEQKAPVLSSLNALPEHDIAV